MITGEHTLWERSEPSELDTPHLVVDGLRAMYVGPAFDLSPHRNAAATIVVGLRAPLTFTRETRRGALGVFEHGHVALVPAGALHHVIASGPVLVLFLDPKADDLSSLDLSAFGPRRAASLAHALSHALRDGSTESLSLATRSLGIPSHSVRPRRLCSATLSLLDFERVEDAAAHADMSVTRFESLFRAEVGVTWRRWRRWRRVALATRALSSSDALDSAALASGFSNATHLCGAFREMFGLAPTSLIARSTRFVHEGS